VLNLDKAPSDDLLQEVGRVDSVYHVRHVTLPE